MHPRLGAAAFLFPYSNRSSKAAPILLILLPLDIRRDGVGKGVELRKLSLRKG